MTLAAQIIADLSAFFNTNEFAQAVTYGGNSIIAIFEPDEDPTMTPEHIAKTGTLYVKASDVATPAYRDAVVIGSNTWYVIGIPGDSRGGIWMLRVERDVRKAFGS